MIRAKIGFLVALFFLPGAVDAAPIVSSVIDVTLNTGSLAGVTFPVSFSYDAGLIQPTGFSYLPLESFDFVLLGVPFNPSEVFQGRQVLFLDGSFCCLNVSYQVFLPPNSPVANITFYSGVAYIDLNRQSGRGTYVLESTMPEPPLAPIMVLGLIGIAIFAGWRAKNQLVGHNSSSRV